MAEAELGELVGKQCSQPTNVNAIATSMMVGRSDSATSEVSLGFKCVVPLWFSSNGSLSRRPLWVQRFS